MRTIETKLYTYDELSDWAKERARDWYRTCNDDWSDFTGRDVVDDCVETLGKLGFIIDRKRGVSWSGFSSQGDGASFTGSWYASDVDAALVIADRPTDADLKALAEGLVEMRAKYPSGLAASLTRRSHHYAHEMTISIDVEYTGDETDDDGNYIDVSKEDADTIEELCRDAMRWIYSRLESAYDWEMADEQVAETIRSNDYEFTADGELA